MPAQAVYYVAPIALMEDLIEGATVSGTINDVQVSGIVEANSVRLSVITQVSPAKTSDGSLVATIRGDVGNYQIALMEQPASDLTIYLTQSIPAHKVIIPEEYLNLNNFNTTIVQAKSTADTAKSTAETAQTTADTAKSTAETAKTAKTITDFILGNTIKFKWDGVTTGLISADNGKLYKISEYCIEKCVGSESYYNKYDIYINGNKRDELDSLWYSSKDFGFYATIRANGEIVSMVAFVHTAGKCYTTTNHKVTFSEPGVYVTSNVHNLTLKILTSGKETLANNLTFVPESTTSDSGKFLTVGTDGKPAWTSISNAEGGNY